MTIRVCGRLPASGEPTVLERSESGGAIVAWHDQNGPTAAAAVDMRVPVGKLRALSESAAVPV